MLRAYRIIIVAALILASYGLLYSPLLLQNPVTELMSIFTATIFLGGGTYQV